jgi:hypothetical protein
MTDDLKAPTKRISLPELHGVLYRNVVSSRSTHLTLQSLQAQRSRPQIALAKSTMLFYLGYLLLSRTRL